MGFRKGNKCAFLPCSNYMNLSSTSFFSYPRNMDRCQQWIVNSRRSDLLEVFHDIRDKDDTYFYRNYNLCSRHFEDDCFMNSQTKNRLIKSAVPTIFSPAATRRRPGRPPGRKPKLKLSEHTSDSSHAPITSSLSVRPHPCARGGSKRSVKNQREISYDVVEGLSTTITAADAASSSPVVINMPHNLVSPVIINVPGAKNSPLILSLSEDKVWTNVNPVSGRVEDRKNKASSKGGSLSLSEALKSVATNRTNSTVRSGRPSQVQQFEETAPRRQSVPILMSKQVQHSKFVSNVKPNSSASFNLRNESYSRHKAKKSRVKFAPGPVVLTINEPLSPDGSFTPIRPVAETIELAKVQLLQKRSHSPDGLSWTDEDFDQSSDNSCSSSGSYSKRQKVIHLSATNKSAFAVARSSNISKRLKVEPHSSDGMDYSWTNVSCRSSSPTGEVHTSVCNPTLTSSKLESSAGASRAGGISNKVRGVKLVSMDKLLDLNVTRQSRIAKREQQQKLELQELDRLRIAHDRERWMDDRRREGQRRVRPPEGGAEGEAIGTGGREVPSLAALSARMAHETRDCSVLLERPLAQPSKSPSDEDEGRSPADHTGLYLTRQLRRFRPHSLGTTDRTPDHVSYPGPAHSAGEVKRLMDASPSPPLTRLTPVTNTFSSRKRILEQISTKCNSLDREIEVLSKQRTLLASRLNVYRNDRHIVRKMIRKQLTDLRTAVRKYSSEYCALEYLKDRMPASTFKFFKCQLFSCKCPQWDFDSMQIPVIAKRCGLGVRETLFKILRMPTLRTFTRYRNILLKNPSAVEDGHIVKNDLLINKYRRKIIRKRINFERNVNNLKSVSEILLDYVKKNNVELSSHEQ